ncbi:MAG: response regulator [Anaerolineaceae bacterium]|nr:MAG: response regulator [Anaerolineaceae bacterium]
MTENKTVLLVEDDEEVAALVKIVLRKIEVVVVHRNNAMDALSFLDQFTPDLILLDIGMPVMNGWQFLNEARKDHDNIEDVVPVIVLTAFSDSTNRMESQLQGVKAFLSKPVTPSELREIVTRTLNLNCV